MDPFAPSIRHYLFFDVSFITLREGVATLGNDDVVGLDVAVTLAGIHARPGAVQCDALVIIDQATGRVWFADLIRPEWAFMRIGTRRFRWEIITGATLRHYCLTFQSPPELERFTELFLNGRRAALGWALPRDLPRALEVDIAHAPSQNRERQTGGEVTLLPDADDSNWDMCVAFVRLFIGLAIIRVVMVLSDRAVDTLIKYYQ